MGCDGGTIPKRDELVRQKQKAEVKDKNAANMAKWRHCALKHDALKRPVVADYNGLLYNKDAVLEYLLDRTQFEHGPTHIKKLKDVKELQLTENPSFKSNHNDLGNEYLDVYSSPFVCPLTGLEMNGTYKFCVIWTCGCVLSDRALRSINNNNNSQEKLCCPKCGKEYSSNDDVLILNPEGDDIQLMEQRREKLMTNQKKNGTNKRKLLETEEEQNEKKIKTKTETNPNKLTSSSSSSSTTTTKLTNSSEKSIQKDPTKSDLYKSLFTTSDAAKKKEQNKPHWITYNPLYF